MSLPPRSLFIPFLDPEIAILPRIVLKNAWIKKLSQIIIPSFETFPHFPPFDLLLFIMRNMIFFFTKNTSLRRPASSLQLYLATGLTLLLLVNFMWTDKDPWVDLLKLQNKWIKDYEPPFETDLGTKDYDNVEEDVFKPLGYKMRDRSVIPTLDYEEPLNCPQVFTNFLKGSEGQNESATPPRIIPWRLKGQYLLNGYAHLVETYADEHSGMLEVSWHKDEIKSLMSRKGKDIYNYDYEGQAIYFAMLDYGVQGKKGMVVGSRSPWVEAIPLKLGAEHITTVEYMKINVLDYPNLSYKHPVELAKEYTDHVGQYDFIVTFSSMEHAGLGRYGDALDPMGDFKEAQKVHCLLKKGGIFYAGMPIGWDIVHWNLHRIYGRVRLSLFAAGFEILGMYYKDKKEKINVDWFEKPLFDIEEAAHINFGQDSLWKQPVFVLRKR